MAYTVETELADCYRRIAELERERDQLRLEADSAAAMLASERADHDNELDDLRRANAGLAEERDELRARAERYERALSTSLALTNKARRKMQQALGRGAALAGDHIASPGDLMPEAGDHTGEAGDLMERDDG